MFDGDFLRTQFTKALRTSKAHFSNRVIDKIIMLLDAIGIPGSQTEWQPLCPCIGAFDGRSKRAVEGLLNYTSMAIAGNYPLQPFVQSVSCIGHAASMVWLSNRRSGSTSLSLILSVCSSLTSTLRLRSYWLGGARQRLKAAQMSRCFARSHAFILSQRGPCQCIDDMEIVVDLVAMQANACLPSAHKLCHIYSLDHGGHFYCGRTQSSPASRPAVGGLTCRRDQHQHEIWKELYGRRRNRRTRYPTLLQRVRGNLFGFMHCIRTCELADAQLYESYAIQEGNFKANNLLKHRA